MQAVRKLKSRAYMDVRFTDRSVQQVLLDDLANLPPVESFIRIVGEMREQVFICAGVDILGGVAGVKASLRPSRLPGDLGTDSVDLVLKERHLFLRSPQLIANMRFRATIVHWLRRWFDEQGLVEFAAPILTPLTLYEPDTALVTTVGGRQTFLTQCVGYYLEAAVHAIGSCYNLGPSFRGAESKSRRHLAEFWHVKAELLLKDRDGLMSFVDETVAGVASFAASLPDEIGGERCRVAADVLGDQPERVRFEDAHAHLARGADRTRSVNDALSPDDEREIVRWTGRPTWVVGTPARLESPRYRLEDSGLQARTADLLLPGDYGELAGVAEKIVDIDEWRARQAAKPIPGGREFAWLDDLHSIGAAPHGGFGMGLERLLRWLAGGHHVRDFTAFPRLHHRAIYP